MPIDPADYTDLAGRAVEIVWKEAEHYLRVRPPEEVHRPVKVHGRWDTQQGLLGFQVVCLCGMLVYISRSSVRGYEGRCADRATLNPLTADCALVGISLELERVEE